MQKSQFSLYKLFIVLLLGSILAACGTGGKKRSGGYYQDDGPGRKKVNIDSVPNATPRDEPINQATLKPYSINGKRFVPLRSAEGFVQEGRASWYGKKYHGRKTSNGEIYDMYKMTAAHPTLPLPSYVRVTNVVNQRSVIVRVNDRGPFIGNRIIDLSYVAARKLGVVSSGTGNVIVESISSNYRENTATQKPVNASSVTNRAYNGGGVQPQGEIPAANQNYRYSLPASQQAQRSVPQTSQQQASKQRPQLVPSYSGTNNQAKQTYNQTSPQTSQNQTPQSGVSQYQAVPPRFSAGQWIQVGAFSVRNNAEKLVSRLNTSGYQNTQVRQENSLYKVLVGPVSQQQVFSTQRSLKTNGYSAIIVKP